MVAETIVLVDKLVKAKIPPVPARVKQTATDPVDFIEKEQTIVCLNHLKKL